MATCKLYLSKSNNTGRLGLGLDQYLWFASEFIYVDELVSRKNDVTGFEEKRHNITSASAGWSSERTLPLCSAS